MITQDNSTAPDVLAPDQFMEKLSQMGDEAHSAKELAAWLKAQNAPEAKSLLLKLKKQSFLIKSIFEFLDGQTRYDNGSKKSPTSYEEMQNAISQSENVFRIRDV